MLSPSRGFRNRVVTLSICVCGVLTLSTTLSASSTVFQLGNANSYYQNYGNEPAGPYPGTLTAGTVTSGTWNDSYTTNQSSLSMFFCLDGNMATYWGYAYQGTGQALTGQNSAEEEAAFLASLMIYDAQQDGITLSVTQDSNGKADFTQTTLGAKPTTTVADFVNQVEGPISFAIWQIMGTLDGPQDPAAQPYVTEAQTAWTNVLSNSSSALTVAFNSSVMIFSPDNSAGLNFNAPSQRFITAVYDGALIKAVTVDPGSGTIFDGASTDTIRAIPEPGTLVLFGTGALLIALGCTRRLARRPR